MNVWVAVLAAPAIWHEAKMADLNAIKDVKLDWRIPYLALWRADYRREDGWIDSWKVIIKKPNGEWEGFGVSPKKSGTSLASVARHVRLSGALGGRERLSAQPRFTSVARRSRTRRTAAWVIYPFRKIGKSPKNAYGVMDVLTEAFEEVPGVHADGGSAGETSRVGQVSWAFCYTTGEVEKIFDDSKEKQKKKEIIERFKKMNLFCIIVRSRIEAYMSWCKKTHEFCVKSKAGMPQAAALVDALVWAAFRNGQGLRECEVAGANSRRGPLAHRPDRSQDCRR